MNPAHDKPPLRVLFVLLSGNLGGAERVALELVEGLDRARFTPFVVVPAEGPVADAARRMAPVSVVPARWWLPYTEQDSAYHFRQYWERLPEMVDPLVDMVGKLRIDVVYSCTGAILHGAIAALVTGRPHLHHLQDLLRHPDGLTMPFRSPRLTYRVLGSLSSVVVCVGGTVRRDVAADIPSAKVRIVPLGFSAPRNDVTPLVLPESEGRTRVGIVGRVSPRKGIGVVPEIVRRVAAAESAVRFYWLGPGSPEVIGQLRAQAEIGGAPALHFLGFHADPRPFMAAIDFLLHPSRIDAFPRVLVEAALAGRTAVATRCGGTAEIVEDRRTGLLLPVDDPAALSDAVLFLVRNPTVRREMGAAARESAAPFTMAAYVAGMEQALLDAHAAGPAVFRRWLRPLLRAAVYAPSRANPVLRRCGVMHALRFARGRAQPPWAA